jgi:hypothetical protein
VLSASLQTRQTLLTLVSWLKRCKSSSEIFVNSGIFSPAPSSTFPNPHLLNRHHRTHSK